MKEIRTQIKNYFILLGFALSLNLFLLTEVKCYAADFVEENNSYTLLEIEEQILELEKRQNEAANLAKSARILGWPEDCETIQIAQKEWKETKLLIDKYQIEYEQRMQKKKEQYPIAVEIWEYMRNLGWNNYICAGIMGNLMTETGGQTLNINPISKNSKYYGICQWSKTYEGVWEKDLIEQLNYLNSNIAYEFNLYGSAYKNNFEFKNFLELTNEREAALAFAKCYERCSAKSHKIRQENAVKAYNYFTE